MNTSLTLGLLIGAADWLTPNGYAVYPAIHMHPFAAAFGGFAKRESIMPIGEEPISTD